MGLVLSPPALLGVAQGIASAERDVADLRQQLQSTTLAAAAPEANIFASAREIAQALSRIPDIRSGASACSTELASAARGVPYLDNLARLDASGRVICAARPTSIGTSAASLPVWRTIAAQMDFVVSGVTESRVSHRRVVLGLLPLRGPADRFAGTLDVTIDVGWLDAVLKASRLPPGSVMAIFDRDRHMIAGTNPGVAHALFGRLGAASTSIAERDDKGQAWTSATAQLLGASVLVGFAMPDTALFGGTYARAAIELVLPFAMILLSWTAIWIVTDRQLLRWVGYLRQISAAYRSGDYALRPALEGAPSEFRLLGDALAEMAAAIDERDRSLREAVAQKSLLIKEIHHRVKNNLQVVMSLLSLQARRLKDPTSRTALADARTRINALALVHRVLYEIDDDAAVDIRRLLELLIEQTCEGLGSERRQVQIRVDIAACDLPSESAVPLSLFTVEAMTNAFKHAFPDQRCGTIRVALESQPHAMLRLSVSDDGVGFDVDAVPGSIGARLIRTFGQQLGGRSGIESRKGQGTTVEMVFPDPAARQPLPA